MPLAMLIVLFGSSVSTAEDGSRSIFGLITYATIFILFLELIQQTIYLNLLEACFSLFHLHTCFLINH